MQQLFKGWGYSIQLKWKNQCGNNIYKSCIYTVTFREQYTCIHTVHILTKEEVQVLMGLLGTDGEENQMRQSIQQGQAEGLTLEEVQRLFQDHGKIDAANELKDRLKRGINVIPS